MVRLKEIKRDLDLLFKTLFTFQYGKIKRTTPVQLVRCKKRNLHSNMVRLKGVILLTRFNILL